MIAIAQSGSEYHYLNWIASESGPMVTHYGKIDKEINDFEQFKQSHKEILSEIISRIDKEELICTYSLDNDSLIFSTCYSIEDNPDLNNWYVKQIRDDSLFKTMDYYYYPFRNGTDQFLSISIPKRVRKSFQDIIRIFNGRLNGISTGIFSAESGARNWFNADKLDSYLIWKIGKKKKDEILFIHNNMLESYFSIKRTTKQVKIDWQFGNHDSVSKICKYIEGLITNKNQNESFISKIFIYASNGNNPDVKNFENKSKGKIVLLNPLSVLTTFKEKKINMYETLPLAETGNAFREIDV